MVVRTKAPNLLHLYGKKAHIPRCGSFSGFEVTKVRITQQTFKQLFVVVVFSTNNKIKVDVPVLC